MGKPKEEFASIRDPPIYMMLPILIKAGLRIVIGIYPELLSGALQSAADTLIGHTHI